uniref:Cytochrome P450 n=1 Tax=Anopheles christyi TaxID=43041 RepID=A0A182K8E3_9DIPT
MVRFEKNPSTASNHSVLKKLLSINKHVAVIMALDMIFAGIDTTSSGSVAILYCLAKHPEKQARLREELRTIMPTKDTKLTATMMNNMPYLRACIKEGLRMFPPTAGNFRASGRDIVMQGYRVPKNTDIAMGAQVLMRDESYFPRPEEFIPERWLNDRDAKISSAKEVNPFIFLPFGFGSRSCIGKRLAMMEMEVILARWIRQFEFRWNYEDYKIRTTVINFPGCPLRFELWQQWLRSSVVPCASKSSRLLSAQAAVDSVDPEWSTAKPYGAIPTPSFMKMASMFGKNGRYANLDLVELHSRMWEDYGDIIRFKGMFGRNDVIMTYSPPDIEKVFRNEGQWPIRRGFDSFAYYRQKVRPDIFSETGGLVTEHGEKWQKVRTIVNPVMMQPKIIKLYIDQVDEIAREFMTLVADMRDAKNELPKDFDQWLNRWALETMGVLALDTRLGVLKAEQSEEAKQIIGLVRNIFELTYHLDVEVSLWKYISTPSYKKLMRVFDDLTQLIMAKIDEAKLRLEKQPSNSANQSVLEKLLKINKHVAVIMSLDMLVAGIDTTSSGSTGILYCLAKHPEKQAKLREELRTILPKKDSPLTAENMHNLPYLRACIKEGLRLYQPVAGNMRAAGRDLVLQGYQIPKGTDIAMGTAVLQRSEKYFRRAAEYLPERWLSERPDDVPSAKDSNPFIFLPFGFGARSCIGRRLAMMEMEIITARLVRQFDLRWNYDKLSFKQALINIPSNPLQFELRELLGAKRFVNTVTTATKAYVDPEWSTAKPYKSIPSPKLFALASEFKEGGRYYDLTGADLFARWREDYGDLIRIKGMLGRPDIVLTFRPEDFEKVYRTEGAWPIRRSSETLAYYRQKVRPEVFGELSGLITTQGETWQKVRTIVNPVMMQPKIIRLYVDQVDAVAREFMTIVADLRDAKRELPVDFDQWLNRWALETMGVLALDTRLGVLKPEQTTEAKAIISLVRSVFDLIYRLEFEPSLWKYFKTPTFKLLMKEFDNLTNLVMTKIDEAVQMIENAPKVAGNESILEKLLRKDRKVAMVMAFDMLMAGIDTTSSSTFGILYCLAKNPQKQTLLRKELRSILPRQNSPLTPENMRNLPYLRACIKEGLRLYQPTPANVRKVGQNIVLQGYRIPKHTEVVMGSLVLQRDATYFPQPEVFLPERWLADGQESGIPTGKDAHPFIFLPFGFGARSCIGRRLAMMEMEIIVARLVRRYEVGWNYGRMKMKMGVVNTPTVPLQFELKDVTD